VHWTSVEAVTRRIRFPRDGDRLIGSRFHGSTLEVSGPGMSTASTARDQVSDAICVCGSSYTQMDADLRLKTLKNRGASRNG